MFGLGDFLGKLAPQAGDMLQPQVGAERVSVNPADLAQGAAAQWQQIPGLAAARQIGQSLQGVPAGSQYAQALGRGTDLVQSAGGRLQQMAQSRADQALAGLRGLGQGVRGSLGAAGDGQPPGLGMLGGRAMSHLVPEAGGSWLNQVAAMNQSPFNNLISQLPEGSALRERLQSGLGQLRDRMGGGG